MTLTVRTFSEQYTHYFDRPSCGVESGPLGGSAAWDAADLAQARDWIVHLSPFQVERLDVALDRLEATGAPMAGLTRADVDLGELGADVRGWSRTVAHEKGILLVRGFPVARWGERRSQLATWCIGLHLGEPGAQNPAGDLLGHVRDDGAEFVGEHTRLYRTNADIRFHCDYADVVGLMCLRAAVSGGESRVASSVAIHDELWRTASDAAQRLYQPVWLDTRDESSAPAVEVTPFVFDGHRVRIFYHSDYFRSVARHDGVYTPSEELIAALDAFDALASSSQFCVAMQLEAGDLQLLSNHSVVHARSSYEDDPAAPRHLLRLWLSVAA
jgi:hypothetical protein